MLLGLTHDGAKIKKYFSSIGNIFTANNSISKTTILLLSLDSLLMFVCFSQGAMACCRKKERKGISDEENSEMEQSASEEEVPGSLNITDEMKRMLSQL